VGLRPSHSVDLVDEFVNFISDLLLVFLLVDVVYSSIDSDDGNGVIDVLQPFLVSFMHFSKIVQTDSLLSLPAALLNALQAQLRRTLQVDDGLEGTLFNHGLANLAVNGIFCNIKVTLTVHYLAEHISISKGGSFRIMKPIRLLCGDHLPKGIARMYGIELESESPSLGILIVVFEHIDAANVLPLVDGLLYGGNIEEGEQGGLAGPQVALNRDDSGHR
jgi:hypothetical protein